MKISSLLMLLVDGDDTACKNFSWRGKYNWNIHIFAFFYTFIIHKQCSMNYKSNTYETMWQFCSWDLDNKIRNFSLKKIVTWPVLNL